MQEEDLVAKAPSLPPGACPLSRTPELPRTDPRLPHPLLAVLRGATTVYATWEALASGLAAPWKALGKEKLEARGLSTPTRAEQLFMGPTTKLTLMV